MNRIRNTVVLGLLAALAGVAGAQDKTRAQVEQEYFQARQNGDVIGPTGYTDRELRPDLYQQPQGHGLTRTQVEQQLGDAVRSGDMLANGESGLREKDLEPGRYPAAPTGVGKSRAQVKAELAQAMASGDMLAPGEIGLPEKQVDPTFYAVHHDLSGSQFAHSAATSH
jgi:hypothetical protein